jgi:peptidoglycan hydrolase-like protein with peptidoglycan-binding domain
MHLWQAGGVGEQTSDRFDHHAGAGTPGDRPNLKDDDRGPGVKLLQQLLRVNDKRVKETSIFDEATRDAVNAVQRQKGWPTGGVGRETWGAIEAAAGGAATGAGPARSWWVAPTSAGQAGTPSRWPAAF